MYNTEGAPKYRRIEATLMEEIAAGCFADALPSENDLAQRFGVSRMTARKALRQIELQGYAERIPGKGTFLRRGLRSEGFFRVRPFKRYAEELNAVPSTRVLEMRQITPPARAAASLGSTEPVILARRLHHFDDTPVRYEVRYLRGDLCGGVLREDLERESIHELLVDRFNLPLTRVWQRMEARRAGYGLASLFQVDEGYPVFHITRVTYTFEQPVTYVEYDIRGEVGFEDTFYPQREQT